MYTEITLKERITMLHTALRELEIKHFHLGTQIAVNKAAAAHYKDRDKRKFDLLRSQAGKDGEELESMTQSLTHLRSNLDALIAEDQAAEAEAEPEPEPTKLSLVKEEEAAS